MEVTKELLSKFFRQECTPEEHAAVNEYFHSHPEELDRYLDEEDWKSFNSEDKLDPAISQHMLNVIESHIDKKAGRIAFIKVISIAASLIAVLGITLFIGFYSYKQTVKTNLFTLNKVNTVYNDTVYNKTADVKIIRLKDGSQVSLSPASELVYQHAFDQKKRDIYLTGEAFFKVAKDKTRPFTVYAGGLSTTALGTSFRIVAFAHSNLTRVQLFTGKVVVKQLKNKDNTIVTDVYLIPGKMVALDRANSITKVSDINGPPVPVINKAEHNTSITGNMISFNNQPLTTVIEVLQKAYQIKINAGKGNLTNRYFTGTVNTQTEQAEEVLRTIAMLNKLSLSKRNGIYVLGE
jgi:ferric-dicitrate binding protein FerR (iron transport regulator)